MYRGQLSVRAAMASSDWAASASCSFCMRRAKRAGRGLHFEQEIELDDIGILGLPMPT